MEVLRHLNCKGYWDGREGWGEGPCIKDYKGKCTNNTSVRGLISVEYILTYNGSDIVPSQEPGGEGHKNIAAYQAYQMEYTRKRDTSNLTVDILPQPRLGPRVRKDSPHQNRY